MRIDHLTKVHNCVSKCEMFLSLGARASACVHNVIVSKTNQFISSTREDFKKLRKGR